MRMRNTAVTIQDGDIVIFMNFRADRAREITQSLIDPTFQGFRTGNSGLQLGEFVCLSEYDSRFQLASRFSTGTSTQHSG